MEELKPKRKGNYRHTGNPIHGLFNVEGEQLTAEEVSKKYGVSVYSIYYWRRKFGAEQAVLKARNAWNKRS